jgi:hypothetical protein
MILIYRGNSKTIKCSVVNSIGNYFILTGYTAKLSMKKNIEDSTPIIEVNSSNIVYNKGEIIIDISPEKTLLLSQGIYLYDIQIANSSLNKKYTVIVGEIKVDLPIST